MPLDNQHSTYDPVKADHDARNVEPKKVKNPKIRKSAESPRRGQTIKVSTDDPFMNFTVGGRTYRTKNGATDIPVEDAEALIAANIPGVRVHGAWSAGIGPGARFNGRFRHEWNMACGCGLAECKWPYSDGWVDEEDE